MIVVDASAVLPAVIDAGGAGDHARGVLAADADQHAPHLIDLELVSALRRLVARGETDGRAAAATLADLDTLALVRHPHVPLLERVWELRDVCSAYDAAYVALAEVLEATLVTADRRLARSSGPRCPIHLLSS